MARSGELQAFIDAYLEAFAASRPGREASALVNRAGAALREPGDPGDEAPCRLDVGQHLEAALTFAGAVSPQLARLAAAFRGIEPSLRWQCRNTSGPFASDNWARGHGNTDLIGATGLEHRGDVILGASLMAPDVRYPDHRHPPEEAYLLLTPGRFMHEHRGWSDPGPGGSLYNEPIILTR